MTVRELLARMSSSEITEWMEFFRLENEERDERLQQGRGKKPKPKKKDANLFRALFAPFMAKKE